MNISNKQYWLAPERRDQTMAFIGSNMLWIACAVLVLLMVINYFVFRMNIDGAKTLTLPMIPTLAAFFAVIGTIIARMILRFRKTNERMDFTS
jgi:bacteriorhodopsin